MPSAKDYENQIHSLVAGDLGASNVEEAKACITRIRTIQRDLRQIKKAINLEIKGIRAEYRDRIANAGSGTAAVFSLFGKRGAAGSIRADAKRAMAAERDAAIEPYETEKFRIDDVLNQLDAAKIQFNDFIRDNKPEQSPGSASGRFCTNCGAKAAKSHKFCAQCGSIIDE